MCYARRQRSSWARIKLSKILYRLRLSAVTTFSSYSFLASFTLLSIYNSSWRDLVFRTSQCFVQSLLLFNFQWPFAVPLPSRADSLTIIPHLKDFVKHFFQISLNFFQTASKSLSELFYLSFFYFLEYIYSLTRSVFSHLLMLCTSLFVVQFSMTVRCSSSLSGGQLDYYTTPQGFCQALFSNFFKFFSNRFQIPIR